MSFCSVGVEPAGTTVLRAWGEKDKQDGRIVSGAPKGVGRGGGL